MRTGRATPCESAIQLRARGQRIDPIGGDVREMFDTLITVTANLPRVMGGSAPIPGLMGLGVQSDAAGLLTPSNR